MTISSYYQSWQKRLFDISISVSTLLFLWPLFLLISCLISLENGGPVFFIQPRMGYKKKPFQLLKFRTMVKNAESQKGKLKKQNEAPAPMFKMKNDPRYTRLGKVLSRTGLDELPQFINILKGEMSLVGPRPLPLEEARALPKSWDFRYLVRPGILSEWAVDTSRYHSLQKWQELEKTTMEKGGVLYDLGLMVRTLVYLL